MTKDELIEALSAIEHERWADWQKWLHEQGERVYAEGQTTCAGLVLDCGDLILLANDVARWERQIATPYAELSGPEKQSDRDQVARYWPLIVAFVESWLREQGKQAFFDPETFWLATLWREEMTG